MGDTQEGFANPIVSRKGGFSMASLEFIPRSLDPGLKFQFSGFEFSESMIDGSMLAHLKSEGRDDHNSLVFIP